MNCKNCYKEMTGRRHKQYCSSGCRSVACLKRKGKKSGIVYGRKIGIKEGVEIMGNSIFNTNTPDGLKLTMYSSHPSVNYLIGRGKGFIKENRKKIEDVFIPEVIKELKRREYW